MKASEFEQLNDILNGLAARISDLEAEMLRRNEPRPLHYVFTVKGNRKIWTVQDNEDGNESQK